MRNLLVLQLALQVKAIPQVKLVPHRVILPSASTWNEVGAYAVVAVDELDGIARREPISETGLYGPAFAAHHIADQAAVLGVSVGILRIVIVIPAGIPSPDESGRGLCRHPFQAQIQTGNSWNSREIDSGMPGISRRILDGQHIVLRVCVAIQDDIVAKLRNIESPIHLRLVIAGHRMEPRIDHAEETANKVSGVERIATRASNHAPASEPQLQKGEHSEIDLLSEDKRIGDVGMPIQASEKLIHADRTEAPQNP